MPNMGCSKRRGLQRQTGKQKFIKFVAVDRQSESSSALRQCRGSLDATFMRHSIILLILFISILSCANPQVENEENKPGLIDSSAAFMSLFKEIQGKGLHVYSSLNEKGFKYKGDSIPNEFYLYFKSDEFVMSRISRRDGIKEAIYACYQFPISNSITGLIVRTPSQYDESAVELYIWDKNKRQIIAQENLADGFGDEGWYFSQDAWVEEINGDNQLDIVKRRKDYNGDLDDSTKTTITDSLKVFLFNGEKYSLSSAKQDTSKYKLHYWVQ